MQDLEHFKKKEYVEISNKYISPLVVGAIMLVGLVFAMGVLVGSRNAKTEAACPEANLLSKLTQQADEPVVPEKIDADNFHHRLAKEESKVPVPASLKNIDDGPSEAIGESLSEKQELARVAVQKPVADEEPVPEKIRDDEDGVYTLQVGTFQDKREASLLQQRLTRAGHNTFLVRVNMPERGGDWFRVRVGPFTSKKQVWSYKSDFEEKEGLPAFVVKRRRG